ncbi:MAG: hypothetical protein HQL64_10230 [Magnetococcales bacterium]|nr:hypothetical protein [Magnetococcales bacterium]
MRLSPRVRSRSCHSLVGLGALLIVAGSQTMVWSAEESTWSAPAIAPGKLSESGGSSALQPDFKRMGFPQERGPGTALGEKKGDNKKLDAPSRSPFSSGSAPDQTKSADRPIPAPPATRPDGRPEAERFGDGSMRGAAPFPGSGQGQGGSSGPAYRWDAPPPDMLDQQGNPDAPDMNAPPYPPSGNGQNRYPAPYGRRGNWQPGMNPNQAGPDQPTRSPGDAGPPPGSTPQGNWDGPPNSGGPYVPSRSPWGSGYGSSPGGAPPGWGTRGQAGGPYGGQPYPGGYGNQLPPPGYGNQLPPPGYGNPTPPPGYGPGRGEGAGYPSSPEEEGIQSDPSRRNSYGPPPGNPAAYGNTPPAGYGNQPWRGNPGPGYGGRPWNPGRANEDSSFAPERGPGGGQRPAYSGYPAPQDGYPGAAPAPQGYPGPGSGYGN